MKTYGAGMRACVCVGPGGYVERWKVEEERGLRLRVTPGFHDSSLSPVFKAWQLVSLSALFACLFHGPPPSHFTAQGYCKSMHEIAMTNIWAGCRVSSIEIPSFFEFLVRRFLSGKEKERKVGWEYIFKVDILKWRGGTFGVYFRGYILSKQRGLDRGLE